MEDYKPAPSPFQSGVKLSVTSTTLEDDATLYLQHLGKLMYLTHTCPDLSFAVGLVSLDLCTNLMKVTGKKLKEYFDIFKVQFSLGFIIVQEHIHC